MIDMQKQRAFTMIELLVVIAIIAVLVGLLFPAIGAIRRNAKKKESDVKVRNIVQSMITYSAARKNFFPGFDGFSFTTDRIDTTGNSGPGSFTQARFWILLDGNYTVADGLISPAEDKDPWQGNKVTEDNYSYAMLQLTTGLGLTPADAYRRIEWRNQQNPLAPLVTDRLAYPVGETPPIAGNTADYLSIHDDSTVGHWVGSIGFGDLSVEFSDTSEIETRFDGYRNDSDDIFTATDGTGSNEEPKKNASVAFRSANIPAGEVE